jgi:hypothetical protein
MLTKSSEKVGTQHYCESCDYSTSRSDNYSKHLLTAKHINLTLLNKKVGEVVKVGEHTSSDDISSYSCDNCTKKYKTRAGLWYHKKKCSQKEEDKIENTLALLNTSTISKIENNLILELLKQNGELQKKIIEMAKEPHDNIAIRNNNGTVNNNNNKTFNLQFFLNETCKDAMNINQFIDNIQVSFEDIENLGNNGYVKGITDIIVKELNTLDVTQRPFHCTDVKRETMYIKDNNSWDKDSENLTKMKNAITKVVHKNKVKTKEWCQEHPNIGVLDSGDNKTYMKLFEELMAQPDENKAKTKVIQLLAKAAQLKR